MTNVIKYHCQTSIGHNLTRTSFLTSTKILWLKLAPMLRWSRKGGSSVMNSYAIQLYLVHLSEPIRMCPKFAICPNFDLVLALAQMENSPKFSRFLSVSDTLGHSRSQTPSTPEMFIHVTVPNFTCVRELRVSVWEDRLSPQLIPTNSWFEQSALSEFPIEGGVKPLLLYPRN